MRVGQRLDMHITILLVLVDIVSRSSKQCTSLPFHLAIGLRVVLGSRYQLGIQRCAQWIKEVWDKLAFIIRRDHACFVCCSGPNISMVINANGHDREQGFDNCCYLADSLRLYATDNRSHTSKRRRAFGSRNIVAIRRRPSFHLQNVGKVSGCERWEESPWSSLEVNPLMLAHRIVLCNWANLVR